MDIACRIGIETKWQYNNNNKKYSFSCLNGFLLPLFVYPGLVGRVELFSVRFGLVDCGLVRPGNTVRLVRSGRTVFWIITILLGRKLSEFNMNVLQLNVRHRCDSCNTLGLFYIATLSTCIRITWTIVGVAPGAVKYKYVRLWGGQGEKKKTM